MPSTPSPSLRIELQATGENVNQWGIKVNDNALVMLEQAITKVTPIALTGNKTLTVTNYVTDEARSAALIFTDAGMSANATVTIPAVQKLYYVENRGATYSITFTAGGVTGVLPAARKGFLICNGTDVTVFDPKADVIGIVTAAETARDLSQSWATLMAALVNATDYSSKEYAAGTTAPAGSAKSWATKTAAAVGTSGEYAAKEYAIGDLTGTGGSAKAWATDAVSPDGSANLSAKTYAGQASTAATNAGSSASSAAGFASAASASAVSAAASYDSFDDRYLGSKASAPTVDNDGDPLLIGALYWSTALTSMQVWSGTSWGAFVPGATDYYNKSQVDAFLAGEASLAGATFTGRVNLTQTNLGTVTTGTAAINASTSNVYRLAQTGNITMAISGLTAGNEVKVIHVWNSGTLAFTGVANWDIGKSTVGTSFTETTIGKTALVAGAVYEYVFSMVEGTVTGRVGRSK